MRRELIGDARIGPPQVHLPPLECSILELKFVFGMTDEEMVEVLDLPVQSLQSRRRDTRIRLFDRAEAQQ